MPDDRLKRTRASLPTGYQFGDAARVFGVDWSSGPDMTVVRLPVDGEDWSALTTAKEGIARVEKSRRVPLTVSDVWPRLPPRSDWNVIEGEQH